MATQKEETKAVEKIIVKGPSKFDLMTSLFYGDYKCRVRVYFETADGAKIWAFIDQIEREDGSGESWNISGTIKCLTYSDSSLIPSPGTKKFSAYYRSGSGNRGGRIKILTD